jgi:hypothetical protein
MTLDTMDEDYLFKVQYGLVRIDLIAECNYHWVYTGQGEDGDI